MTTRAPRRKKTSLQSEMDTTIRSIRQGLNDLLKEGNKELAEVEDRQNIKKIISAMDSLLSHVDGLMVQDATLQSHVADIKEIGREYQNQIVQHKLNYDRISSSSHENVTSLYRFFKLTLNQLEAWLEVVCGLLQYAYRPPNQEQDMPFCPVHALMAVYLFNINRIKNNERLVVPKQLREILGMDVFSRLLKFAKSWPISCIPGGVFIPKSFSGETNILMDLLIFFKKHEIADNVCSNIFRLFLLGNKSSKADSASAVFRKLPNFSLVYRDEEIKHDEDSVTQNLSREDRNRILAFLIKHQYHQTIEFLMDTYLFSLSDDDLCWICQHNGVSTADEEIVHWLYQLKFGREPQENDWEEFRNDFRVCLRQYFEAIQAKEAMKRERAVDSFLPVTASSTEKKSKKERAKKGKKGRKGKKGKNDPKTNPPPSVSESDQPKPPELKDDAASESDRPKTPELKDDTDTPLHVESEIEWPKILIGLCDSNTYREFNLPGKLENVLLKLDDFPDSGQREKNEVLRWIEDFNKLLKNFCNLNIDRHLKKLSYEVFSHGDALSLLRDCAKIIVLCEVFQSWNDSSEKLLSKISSDKFSKTTESLNISDWSQWKRSIFLKHSLAFNIKEFIDGKFKSSFIYCSEKRCYQVKDNELNGIVNTACNELLQKRGLIFDFAHALLQKSHQIRVKIPSYNNEDKPNTPLEKTFGDLCSHSFFHYSSWDDSKYQREVSPFLQKNCKVLPPHLNFSTRLTASFLLLSQKVCLPKKLRTLSSLDEKLFSERELEALAYTIPKSLPESLPEHSFGDHKVDTVPVPDSSSNHPGNFHTVLGHPLFTRLLAWPENQGFVYLSGCLAGLSALAFSKKSKSVEKIDFGKIETYLTLDDSDVDLLTPNNPTSWPRAISKKLSGQASSYHWQLWGYGGIAYNGRSVPVDLVQITPKNVDMSNDELLENYKKNGSITALDAMAYEIFPDGHCRWVSGDVTLLKAQIASGHIEMTGYEQFQEFISKVTKNLRKSNDEIDNGGLKLLKFLDTIIKLSYIHHWEKNFSLGMLTLNLILSNLDKVKQVIEHISPQRKQAFLSKIFKKPERYLRNYLLLLLKLKLFGSFFYVNPQNFDNRETIMGLNNIAKSIESWLRDDTDKSSSRLHNQTVAFLAMEQYLKFQYQQSRTSYDDFLIRVAQRCFGHIYERSKINLFSRALRRLNTAFAGRKQEILSSLLCPEQRPYQLLELNRPMSSAIEYYHPLEMKNDGERPSTVSALAEEQHEMIARELYKQVADVLNKNLPIKKMPKAVLRASINGHSFSVELPTSDRDSTCMFVVFFMAKGNQWHTFLGVFETTISFENDMLVRVTPAVAELLKDAPNDAVLHYRKVAPYLGILYELDVCYQLKLADVRAPILEKMLERTAGQPVPEEVDSLPKSPSLTREQNKFSHRVLRRMQREQTSVSTLTGPPGTGKTATSTQLACEAVKSTYVETLIHVQPTWVRILTHSNMVVRDSAAKLRALTSAPIVYRVKREKLNTSGEPHPSLDALFDFPVKILKNIQVSSPIHLEKDVERINQLQHIIQQIMPVFAHQVNARLDNLISQLVSSSESKRASIFDSTCNEIMSLIRDTSSHKVAVFATARFAVMTLHYASNSIVQHATELRRMLFPEERVLTIIEEASRGGLSSAFRALTLSEPHHAAIIGDLAQLPPVTHCDPPPPSFFKWCAVQLKRQGVPQDKLTLTFRTDRKGAEFWGGLGYRGEIRSAHDDGGFFNRAFQALRQTGKIPYLKRITFIDVPGCEAKEEGTNSYVNTVEAKTSVQIAVDIFAAITTIMRSKDPKLQEMKAWIAETSCLLAIVTMYSAQAKLINQSLEALSKHRKTGEQMRDRVRCVTVDGFQGSEALITIISSVRTKEIGHIGDSRRLTVAMSRFRVGTVFLGHEALFTKNAQAIKMQITEEPEVVSLRAKEGVFIQLPNAGDQTLLCLAKGYDGASVWCRLSQSDGNCQVDVLNNREQKRVVDSFKLPDISIEGIKREDKPTLKDLEFLLLNRLSTAVPEQHIQSGVNLKYIRNYCQNSAAIVKRSFR